MSEAEREIKQVKDEEREEKGGTGGGRGKAAKGGSNETLLIREDRRRSQRALTTHFTSADREPVIRLFIYFSPEEFSSHVLSRI